MGVQSASPEQQCRREDAPSLLSLPSRCSAVSTGDAWSSGQSAAGCQCLPGQSAAEGDAEQGGGQGPPSRWW